MKRSELNATARNLLGFLASRNNDINGYWGIGMLCAIARQRDVQRFAFRILYGDCIRIHGCELTDSRRIVDALEPMRLDAIEGRISFFPDGHYAYGRERYTCGLAVAVTQAARTGLAMAHIDCWAHDPSRERPRRSTPAPRFLALPFSPSPVLP